jgi:hypothetical protein
VKLHQQSNQDTTAKTRPHNLTTVTEDLIGFETETRYLNNTRQHNNKEQNMKGRMESDNDIEKNTQEHTRQHSHFTTTYKNKRKHDTTITLQERNKRKHEQKET